MTRWLGVALFALAALLSTEAESPAFEGSAPRAERMVELRSVDAWTTGQRNRADDAYPRSIESARAAEFDELPASDSYSSTLPEPTPIGRRDDPGAVLAAILAAIDTAAEEFGHEAERMRIIAFCESRWDPRAVGDGGTSFGLWQFQLPTWRANVARAGFEYSDADVFDPVASSRVAAWMWGHGGELLWTCAR